MPTTSLAGQKLFYCKMHRRNRTHNTRDCFELKQCAKCVKENTSRNKADKVIYKYLHAFINAKVTAALNKAKKNQKKKVAEKITINAFNKFCSLKVKSSNKESNPEVNALAAADSNDSNSNASCVPSNDSKSDNK
eukprot:1334059-Ditylum_brightwellii.AAC.2